MLRSLGFSQLSVGVPDMHAGDGGSVEYFRSAARIRGLLEAARALQFEAINVDLGYGRSWQTGTSFARKLASIIELQPDRVSLFDYRSLSIAGRLPSPRLGLASRSAARDMHRHGVEQLTAAGYRLLGLGCFVLPHDELALAQENESLRHDVAGYSTTPESTDHLSLASAPSADWATATCSACSSRHATARRCSRICCRSGAACTPPMSTACAGRSARA